MGSSNGTNMHVCFLIAVEKMENSAAVILYKGQLFVCVVCTGHVQVRSAHAGSSFRCASVQQWAPCMVLCSHFFMSGGSHKKKFVSALFIAASPGESENECMEVQLRPNDNKEPV